MTGGQGFACVALIRESVFPEAESSREGPVTPSEEHNQQGDTAHAARLDWRVLLRRFLTDRARNDYSWSAPNRRFIDSSLYLPPLRAEGMETLAVIIDTYGSLPTEILGEFWSEPRGLVAEVRPERVFVIRVDSIFAGSAPALIRSQ